MADPDNSNPASSQARTPSTKEISLLQLQTAELTMEERVPRARTKAARATAKDESTAQDEFIRQRFKISDEYVTQIRENKFNEDITKLAPRNNAGGYGS
jgi:hypothetical protein